MLPERARMPLDVRTTPISSVNQSVAKSFISLKLPSWELLRKVSEMMFSSQIRYLEARTQVDSVS